MTVVSTLSDSGRLTKCIVILDIFRASNTVIQALDLGAARVVVVEELEYALQLKSQNPDWLALGERGGIKLDGFDGDNSPTGLSRNVSGKTVILTTSGGARCVESCPADATVLIGSFANASAIAAALHGKASADVSFWAVGERAEIDAEEDLACAEYLEAVIGGKDPDPGPYLDRAENGPGAERLRQLEQVSDLAHCLKTDFYDLTPTRQPQKDPLLNPTAHQFV